MEQVSKIILNDSKIDFKNQEFHWELYERWFDIYLMDVELFREIYKNDFILWGYASLRKNVYDDDYNLIECFEKISKTLNKKNIAKIIFDEIY